MSTPSNLWRKLEKSKRYREEFVAAQLKRGIPFQVRALRKNRKWSQEELATHANLTQGVVSRAEDPDYGNLTFNSVLRLAAGFDVAFIGKFVPFSELGKWFVDLSEESVQVPSFGEDTPTFEASRAGFLAEFTNLGDEVRHQASAHFIQYLVEFRGANRTGGLVAEFIPAEESQSAYPATVSLGG